MLLFFYILFLHVSVGLGVHSAFTNNGIYINEDSSNWAVTITLWPFLITSCIMYYLLEEEEDEQDE